MGDELAASAAVGRAGATVVALVIVAAVWAVVQASALGRTPFHTRGEPREAVVVQDLIRRGDWILPRRNGTALPRKPPLYYWLAGISARATGAVDERSVRLPSALQSGVAALLVTAVTAATVGPLAATAAGVVLVTSFEWLRAATAGRVDMTLAFGLTLVFAGLLRLRTGGGDGWRWLVYAGAAWATLSKGVPGLAIPVLQIALLCAVDRSLAPLRALRPLTGLIIVLAVAGAWYAAAAWQGGRPFVDIVVNENLVRAVGGARFNLGHEHGVGYLLGALLAGLLPWTVVLPAACVDLWRDRTRLTRRDARVFAVLWIAAVFLPYALASSKRGVYLLPLYPAVGLLIGSWVASVVSGVGRTSARPFAWVAWLLALALGIVATMAAAEFVGVPLLASITPFLDARAAADVEQVIAAAAQRALLAAAFAVAALAAVAAALALARQRWAVGLTAFAISAVAATCAVRWVILPAIGDAQTRRPLASELRRLVGDGGGLATAPSLDYGLLFYWGEPVPVWSAEDGGDPPRYLLVPEGERLRRTGKIDAGWHRVPILRSQRGGSQGTVVVLERR